MCKTNKSAVFGLMCHIWINVQFWIGTENFGTSARFEYMHVQNLDKCYFKKMFFINGFPERVTFRTSLPFLKLDYLLYYVRKRKKKTLINVLHCEQQIHIFLFERS